MIEKPKLKNTLVGVLIGLIILFIIGLVWYYLYILKPLKEAEEILAQVDLFEQRMEEYMKLQQSQQDK
jgi:hypothetical protein